MGPSYDTLSLSEMSDAIQRETRFGFRRISHRRPDHLSRVESLVRREWDSCDGAHLRCQAQDRRADFGSSGGALSKGQPEADHELPLEGMPDGRTLVVCKKKEARLSALEKLAGIYGDQWVWISFDAIHKVVIHFVVGRHTQKNADRLVQGTKDRSDGHLPLFTSDELKHYDDALLKVYGIKQVVPRTGKRGRPRNPRCLPPPELLYAQVVKRRRKGRIVDITARVIFGSKKEVAEHLAESSISRHINTSFVERENLTLRHHNRRLTRKTISFSKKRERLTRQLHLSLAYYHFVKPHLSLREVIQEGEKKKYLPRTPAMAAGITDQIWTMEKLFSHEALQAE
jgi:IS1 family transposase